MSTAAKCFDTLATSLSDLHNYFDELTKFLSDLYLKSVAKIFLDTLAKLCSFRV